MRYHVPVLVRRHHDDRWTISLIDPLEADVAAHGATRENAERLLREVLVERIEDAADGLGDRLARKRSAELRRVKVPIRVRHGSGRRSEVVLPVTAALITPEKGEPEVSVPRLGLYFDVTSASDVEEAVRDEVRQELAGSGDAGLLRHALDADETIELLEVSARPRDRARRRRPRDEGAPDGPLAQAAVDLTAAVKRGAPAVAHEREPEIATLLDALGGQPAASVLLVGAPGVGKTAIVEEAVRRCALGNGPAALADTRFYYLGGNQVIAGMSYLGEWQERAKQIADAAREQRAVLFVGDLAELCEAGRSGERHAGVARFFAPYVLRGEIVLVAEASPERLRRVERIDASIIALFRRLEVGELDARATTEVLRRVSGATGRRHGVTVAPEAVDAVVELTRRFMPGRRWPGKAVDLLSRVAERRGVARRAQGETGGAGRDAVIAAFGEQTGLPEVVLRDERPLRRDAFIDELSARVVEQPEAIEALADAVLLVKTGLNDPKKPVSVYLFVGPTGVGKTESARVLAERLFGDAKRLLRFDMTEYQDPGGHLRLVGSETLGEGELARRVREQPFSVILLDEIEKAHEAVFDMLLSVLGEGRLVDHGGRVADFRSSIIILTSNIGATEAEPIGFGGGAGDARAAIAARYQAAAERFFRPELINRIDRIVPFGALSREAIERIARRELDAIVEREGIARRRARVRFARELVPFLGRVGHHERFGARPLKREVESRVLAPLSRHLVRRSDRTDVDIELWLDGEQVRLAVRDREPPRTPARAFCDLPPPFTAARIADAVSVVRVRAWELRESWIVRERGDRAGVREGDARAAALIEALERITAELRGLDDARDAVRLEGIAATLVAADRELTAIETGWLLGVLAPAPLPELVIVEVAHAEEPGAAARALADNYARWAEARGIGVEREQKAVRVKLRFADPAAAAALAVEAGLHDLGSDLADRALRGARVRVGAAPDVIVREWSATPTARAEDPRTGLRLPGPPADLAPEALDRFLLAGWRVLVAADGGGAARRFR